MLTTRRFTGRDREQSPSGHPLLPGGLAWLDCEITALHQAGDHEERLLGACAPGPGQVFAIGVNYTDRAAEARVDMAVRLPDRAGCHRRAAA